jgi:hypothetical protein
MSSKDKNWHLKASRLLNTIRQGNKLISIDDNTIWYLAKKLEEAYNEGMADSQPSEK